MRLFAFASLIALASAAPHEQIDPRTSNLAEWGTALTKLGSWLQGFSPAPQSIINPNTLSGDENKSIYEILKADDNYSKYIKVIEANDEVVRRLKDNSMKLTVFAPSNDAFPQKDHELKEAFYAHFGEGDHDKKRDEIFKLFLYEIALYHQFPGEFDTSRLAHNSTFATQLRADHGSMGSELRRAKVESQLLPPRITVNTYASVTVSNIKAKNGIIHRIDGVLVPPGDIMQLVFFYPSRFSISASALLKVNLEDELEYYGDNRNWHHRDDKDKDKEHGRTITHRGDKGRFRGYPASTFFLPTNDAWNKLPEELVRFLFGVGGEDVLKKIMQFHIVPDYVLHTEWVRHIKSDNKDKQHRLHTRDEDEDLGFELDQKFPTLIGQDVPVHIKKTRSMIPGSNQYNWEFKVHGIDVSIYDMPALNGALHVVNDVLCPRHSNGRNENQNDEDWTEWKEWLRKWHHDQ